MFVMIRFVEGLAFAHGCLFASYVLGASVMWIGKPAASPAQAMMRGVSTCAVGIALFGLALFLLGAVGLLSAPFLALAFVAIVAGGSILQKRSPFQMLYWKAKLREVNACCDAPSLAIYFVMLLLAFPALIPNQGGDPVTFYLAQAEDWARTGKLVVDPFLRFPFYAGNLTIYYAALFTMRAGAFVNFLPWIAALLTAFGVCASARVFLQERLSYWWAAAAAVALTLSVVLSPVFLHWLPAAYVDIAIGAFALFSAMCLQLALMENDRRWLLAFAVTAGYLIGLKSAFIVLAPVFALAFLIAARSMHVSRRFGAAAFFVFCICAAPWYARNVVLAGDPIAPVGNVALYGGDGLISKTEWQSLQADLNTSRSGASFASLPVRAFRDANVYDKTPDGPPVDFRDYGASALMLLLYAPLLVLAQRVFRAGYSAPAGVYAVLLGGCAVYWFGSSTLLRYALLFYPLLAVCAAAAAAPLLRGRYAGPIAFAVALAAIAPSPGSGFYLHQIYDFRYKFFPVAYTGADSFLRKFGNGYVEEQFTASRLSAAGLSGRIYTLGTPDFGSAYYFRRSGFISMGDWVGPGSYARLAMAVDTNQASRFFDDLKVDGVQISSEDWPYAGFGVPLKRQLLAHGFCALPIPATRTVLLVRGAGSCDRSGA